ncbi:MAG TPA: DeoR/GlpR family DNA-binding transcription regulator [Planctomycetota bacterium]|jgi:DeoR/GlpR family transcriptional regulator of sugar metabolism|nr:DeoR/GlpR family DNA-binding transcription regulator [Planctomycetota bacterium]
MDDRRKLILEAVTDRGACTYGQLAALARVSTMTVRRDVEALASEQRVIKVVGGVRDARATPSLYETEISSRLGVNVPEKTAIAACARDLIRPGQSVYLDGSTTCLHLARKIGAAGMNLTVVTNSALLCLEMAPHRGNTVIALGGQFDPDSGSFVGPAAEEALRGLHVDVAFLSTKGFVPEEGTFESSPPSLQLKRIAAGRCARLVLLADHTKFGLRALTKVLETSKFHAVVTDDQAPGRALSVLRRMGIEVHVASRKPIRASKR